MGNDRIGRLMKDLDILDEESLAKIEKMIRESKRSFTINMEEDVERDYDSLSEDGYKIEEDITSPIDEVIFDVVFFVEEGGACISGDEMRKMAKQSRVNQTLRTGKILLKNQNSIPKWLRKFKIVLPGTILILKSNGRRFVTYLYWWDYWYGNGWGIEQKMLSSDWGSDCCFLVIRSPKSSSY